MPIDNLDLKILYELDKNARMPYSAIAKEVGFSKQTVQKRIEALVKNGVISQFITVINSAQFGIIPSQVYVSFSSPTEEERKKLIESLIKDPLVPQVGLSEGIYDLYFGLFARNQHEIDIGLSRICQPFAKIIKSRKLVQFVDTRLFPRDYLLGRKRELNPLNKGFHSRQSNPAAIKEIDKGIIGCLCQNPRISFTDIARNLNAPVSTIIQRVKFLEKSDIIRGYIYMLDEEQFLKHNILLELNSFSPEIENKLFSYLAGQPSVIFIAKTIGEFDYSINVETRDLKDYRKFAEEFKQIFDPYIKSFVPLFTIKFPKLNFAPKF